MPPKYISSLIVFFINLFLAIQTNALVQDEISAHQMPQPWSDTSFICRPRASRFLNNKEHFICDPSGLLSPNQINKIEKLASNVYNGNRPYSLVRCSSTRKKERKGFRIAIAIVRRMPYDGNTLEQRATLYASQLFQYWGLSQNCGASVLIFMSLADKRMYIATGKLATHYVNSHQISEIYAKMVPLIRRGRIARSLKIAVQMNADYLQNYKGAGSDAAHHTENGHGNWNDPLFFKRGPLWWDLIMSLTVILCTLMLILACCNGVGGLEATRKKRERRHVRRKLDITRMEYVAAMLTEYTPSTCPMCHDDLTPPWQPTVPTLPSENDNLISSQEEQSTPARKTRTLRCGHIFHENCFEDEAHTGQENQSTLSTSTNGTTCPVCGDPGMGTSVPKSLSETRQQDVEFRLRRLSEEYPHILTQSVIEKLTEETPNLWPLPMTDAYMNPSWGTYGRRFTNRDADGEEIPNGWWNGVRNGLAGVAVGGLFYGLLSNVFGGGNNNQNGSYYTDIPSSGGDDNDGPSGGAGMGWGNTFSNVASRFTGGNEPSSGFGTGWGDNSGGDGSNSGSGFGW